MKKQEKARIKFNKRLKKHIKNKDYVKFYRTGTDGDSNISGFILQMSEEFLLIQTEEEFRLNGYSIIRLDRFNSIQLGKTELFRKKILKKEGVLKLDYGINKKINLDSFKSIFRDLKQRDHFAIVECEDLKETTFTIGEIEKSTKKEVEIKYITSFGTIDKEPTKIKYKDITLIKFDDRYTKLYCKYLIIE